MHLKLLIGSDMIVFLIYFTREAYHPLYSEPLWTCSKERRASWENMYGEYFGCINGLCQGGGISPLMFTIYMDELLNQLQAFGIECHIGHKY